MRYRLVRKPNGGLTKYITPAIRRANIGIAEPEVIVKRFTFMGSLLPEQGRDNRRIAPHADRLLGVFLVFVDDVLIFRSVEQVSFIRFSRVQ
jgi:hypothetical protein